MSVALEVESPAEPPPPTDPWPRTAEAGARRRWLVYPLLVTVAGLFGAYLWTYHVAARPGVDQNGYLTTARLIAQDHALGFVRKNPFQFAGHMMVLVQEGRTAGRIYAKYPWGYPLLAALGRAVRGVDGIYAVNPICTVLACYVSFFLFRRAVGNFAALVGVLMLACNPVTLYFANDSNSHASTLLCVVVGFWGLLRWWEVGGWWRGFVGGFALGYACTIRYTEFLLVLPVLFVALAKVRFDYRQVRRSLAPVLGWALPITALAITLWVCYGRPWKTGYSLCKEQTGFGLKYFLGDPEGTPPRQGNWETLLFQLNHTGLFLMLPVVLTGLIAMFWHSWRLATAIALWVVPPTVLYLFYYWAPAGEGSISYLRFFLTVFPGMLLAGLWVLDRALAFSRPARALALGALAALCCAINLANIAPSLEQSHLSSLALLDMRTVVGDHYPAGNVLFADENACDLIDSVDRYETYSLALFQPGAFERFKRAAAEEKREDPIGLQRDRSAEYMRLLGRQTKDGAWVERPVAEIDRMQQAIIDGALAGGQRVAFIFRGGPGWNMLAGRRDLRLRRVTTWSLPAPPPALPGVLLPTKWRNGINAQVQAQRQPAALAAERRQQTYGLYELVKVDPNTPDDGPLIAPATPSPPRGRKALRN